MSEINHFPSATHDGPSHNLLFGDQELPSLSPSLPQPPPHEVHTGVPNSTLTDQELPSLSLPPPLPLPPPPPPPHEVHTGVPNSILTDQGQCSWDNAVMPESQSSTVPQHNMEFSSEEEAYNFYKNYAEKNGFKVRKGKVQRTLDGEVPHTSDGKAPINKRIFLCSKEGKRSQKESEKTRKYRRKETRTGCQAEIRIELKNGKWVIYKCSLGHNHELERPGQRHGSDTYYPNNSQVTVRESTVDGARVVDTEVGTAEDKEVGQWLESDTYPDNSQVVARESTGNGAQVVDEEGGTAKNRSPEEVRVSNFLPDKNIAKLPPDDVQSLLNCFLHLQGADPSFFYAIQVNSENQVTSFFWRDGRSRIDYAYFEDMLVLDTCRYQMDNNVICAPFFGVNHHMDPVLFGCAFLLDETEESFRWLFRTFLEAMGYSQPKILCTALSEAIASAVEIEFPETKHLIVKGFIISEFYVKHLEPYGQKKFHFPSMIIDWLQARSKQEFEERWNLLMEQCELREDPWLAIVYKSREKWSHLFSEVRAFTADLESIRGVQSRFDVPGKFNIFPDLSKTLSDFFEEYLKRTEKFRSRELSEDIKSNRDRYKERIGMDKHAGEVYTRNVYEEFKQQFEKIMSLAIEEVSPGPTCVFKLKNIHTGDEEEVSFDCSSSTVSCSCKKFEREGILCSHSLKVLNAKNIFRIPEQYVWKRWTRSAKQGVEVKGNSARDNMDEKSRRLHSRNLMYKALNVITKSVATEFTSENVERHLDLVLRETEHDLTTELWQGDSSDDEDNDEICCGERHCPFGKRKKIGSASSSGNEVHGS